MSATELVLQEVLAERRRQDGKWGQQNHSVVPHRPTALSSTVARQQYTDSADALKGLNDMDVSRGTVGWDRVLLEEVYEALAESDPRKIREELVQVAAVAVAMIESLDRNDMPKSSAPAPTEVPYQEARHDPRDIVHAAIEVASIRYRDGNGKVIQGPANLKINGLQLYFGTSNRDTRVELNGKALSGVQKVTLTYEVGRLPVLNLNVGVLAPKEAE